MPPLRGRVGVRFQHNAFQAGVDGIFTAAQDRIFNVNGVGETATSGYNLAKLFAAYSFDRAGATSTIAVHLDNAGNLRYHNHLNYLKDFAPEVGRDLRVTYTVSFR
jgi:iron complex outermembrane receptor protein